MCVTLHKEMIDWFDRDKTVESIFRKYCIDTQLMQGAQHDLLFAMNIYMYCI